MAILLVTAVTLLLTFAYIDVWYLARFFTMLYLGRRRKLATPYSKEMLLKPQTTTSIVLPSDIDAFLHMNNAKYMKEYDLARINAATQLGFTDIIKKRGGYFVMNAGTIRYRRSMKLFQTFVIQTRVVGWDKDSIYMEQRTVTPGNNFVTSILLSKFAIRGVSAEQCLVDMCGEFVPSPELSPEVSAWIESVELSSKRLRQEAGLSRNNSSREISVSSLLKR